MAAANDLEMIVSMHVGSSSQVPPIAPDVAVHGQPAVGRHAHLRGDALVAVLRHVPAVPEPQDRAVRGRDRLDPVLPRAGRAGGRQAAPLGEEGRAFIGHAATDEDLDLDTFDVRGLFRDHVFGCFIDDAHGIASIDEIGEDNVMCETDYPHSDSTWPDCIERRQATASITFPSPSTSSCGATPSACTGSRRRSRRCSPTPDRGEARRRP